MPPSSPDAVNKLLLERGLMLSTAESCTGGAIAAAMTSQPGSSAVFDRGFVTYSNESKIEMLGVPEHIIETHGAVSERTAHYMAVGALENSRASIAVSVTGIAGPSGGTAEKPVGTVYIGIGTRHGETIVQHHVFSGDRDAVRAQTVNAALRLILETVQKP